MSEHKIYHKLKFLNRKGHHSIALIFASITKEITKGIFNKKKNKKEKNYVYYDIELKISDCSRIIDLSIDTYTQKGVNNSIHKLDILIKTLTDFRNIFKKEMKQYFKDKKDKLYE